MEIWPYINSIKKAVKLRYRIKNEVVIIEALKVHCKCFSTLFLFDGSHVFFTLMAAMVSFVY